MTLLNWLVAAAGVAVCAPFYLAALAPLLGRAGVAHEALLFPGVLFYVPYFLAMP